MQRVVARNAKPASAPSSAGGLPRFGVIQRKCGCEGPGSFSGECTECKAERGAPLQRVSVGRSESSQVPPVVHEVLRSPGQPLDATTRAFMEPRFGHDFSAVRVHTDGRAAASARAVNALAYTFGRNVVFAAGQYTPDSAAGRRLLAHELAHTIQQDGTPAGAPAELDAGDATTPGEREAERAVAAIEGGGLPQSIARRPRQVARANAEQASPPLQEQPREQNATGGDGGCKPAAGYPPSNCGSYLSNAWWLPIAYVNNASCACSATPNVPTANCVRKFLQDRLAAKSAGLKLSASLMKPLELNPATHAVYQTYVQTVLTPDIYQDHVDAYRSCCCPHGPAPYVDWIGVTTVPFRPCSLVGWFIRNFGSCTGASDSW
jgi:Domain of unknown function (DUF4157)